MDGPRSTRMLGAALWLPLAAGAAPEPVGDPFAGQLLQTGGGLLLVLVVLGALAWGARRLLGGVPGTGGARVRVLGGVSLGPRERAVVVEAEGRRLLLGVAQGSVRLLAALDTGANGDFAARLEAEREAHSDTEGAT